MSEHVRFLSIEGGGIHSLSSIILLAEIERRVSVIVRKNIYISDYLDLIAGNSSGALVAALLLSKNNSKEQFKVDALVQILIDFFQSKLTFEDLFSTKRLSDMTIPCLFPAYEPNLNWMNFFCQHNAILNSSFDFFLKDAISATCALPVWFPPARITSFSEKQVTKSLFYGVFWRNIALAQELVAELLEINIINKDGHLIKPMSKQELYSSLSLSSQFENKKYQITGVIDRAFNNEFTFIDGCLFANNPGLCAVIEASKLQFEHLDINYPAVSDIVLVSMGFRTNKASKYIEKIDQQFKNQIMEILLKSPQELTHFQLQYLFESHNSVDRYYPLYPENNSVNSYLVSDQILDVTEKNIDAIRTATEYYISQNDAKLNQIAGYLSGNVC